MPPLRLFGALIVVLAFVGPIALAKSPVTADEVTRSLLREAEFNQISISPNGKLLAIARTTGKVASVTLHKREDLSPIITFYPGANGAITDLSWVDDSRLIIGATRIDPVDGYAAIEPILVIMPTDGSNACGRSRRQRGVVARVAGSCEHDCSQGAEPNCWTARASR